MKQPRRTDIQRLRLLTKICVESELARMRAAAAESHAIVQKIDALTHEREMMCTDIDTPATRAGMDMVWRDWALKQQAGLKLELVQALARQAQAKEQASQAYGRDAALAKLIARLPVPRCPGEPDQ